MLLLLSQITIDSIKDSGLGNDVLIQLLEPESLYVRISNKYYYFFMGYLPYEIKLPSGFYYFEYSDKKDSLFLKGGYIYKVRFPSLEKQSPKLVSYEYEIKKEFNRDISRDSCYIVLEGDVDLIEIDLGEQINSYNLPFESMFPAKRKIKIITKNFQKELFLEPQFIYYINIKSK